MDRVYNKIGSPWSSHNIDQYQNREHVKALRDYTKHFASVYSQIGALFVINSKVVGMDCFSWTDALKKTYLIMTEGYAEDAAGKFDPKMNTK